MSQSNQQQQQQGNKGGGGPSIRLNLSAAAAASASASVSASAASAAITSAAAAPITAAAAGSSRSGSSGAAAASNTPPTSRQQQQPTTSSNSPSRGRTTPPQQQQQQQQTSGGANNNSNGKKRPRLTYYEPSVVSAVPHIANTNDLSVLHQITSFHLVLHQPISGKEQFAPKPQWHVQAQTILYVIDNSIFHDSTTTATAKPSAGGTHQLALHLRSTCQITDDVPPQVCCLDDKASTIRNLRGASSYYHHHADPLEHVLIKPPSSYSTVPVPGEDRTTAAAANNTNSSGEYRFDADAQCSRGAAGMTSALRVASIASNMGELRLSFEKPPKLDPKVAAEADTLAVPKAIEAWKQDLTSANKKEQVGKVEEQLWEDLRERSADRQDKRIDAIVQRLARASAKSSTQSAFKITIGYKIPLPSDTSSIHHLAGFHAIEAFSPPNRSMSSSSTSGVVPPHVYTTSGAGAYGNHEGPRSWLPCLDSAAASHRATHQCTVRVTAPMKHGLSVLGSGEDFGLSLALLHQSITSSATTAAAADGAGDGSNSLITAAKDELGESHVAMLQNVSLAHRNSDGASHVIPPEGNSSYSLDSIHATVVWCSASWTPIPVRSLGFAVGPFKILEDPEYFGIGAVEGDADDDDDDEELLPLEERHQAFVDAARKNGEGIRQAYFAPLFKRKYIHAFADSRLLPDTNIRLLPLSSRQKDAAKKLDECISYATVGVPHRALSLMCDALALPTFRTASYTQIWIPDAVSGGSTSGAMHCCPQVTGVNPFLGGSIMDSKLLPPVGSRLPFYQGGRVLQFLQARNAIRGWITAALPLGGKDDVSNGYIHSLAEAFIMSLYERGHGAQGEGGGKGGVFFSKRYAAGSGSNSSNLDFLPVRNVEEIEPASGLGPVPIEERHNEQLWRSAINGTESHTSAADEFNTRQLLCRDAVEAVERGTDKDKGVPTPSMGWFGSHLSLTFLSSNATSSSDLGCGAIELLHPLGGLVYRALKCEILRGVVEGRAGIANLTRLFRAAFIAAHLDDIGEKELRLPTRRDKKAESSNSSSKGKTSSSDRAEQTFKPPFVICVNEILKKKGLTHTLFARALQSLAGPLKEAHLLGTLVDVERNAEDPRTRRPFVDPEGFPNSFVRGASLLYCRVGVQVELARDATGSSQSQSVAKGVQMQAYCEPCIFEGGIAFGGPITMRIVENEGQFREYVKDLNPDGSRRDWGATFLHAKPVTTSKAQTAVSGSIEAGSSKGPGQGGAGSNVPSLDNVCATRAFTDTNFHTGGFQAIELIRLTNLTPLLWVRVDPLGLYSGRISVFQPDACLAECLFHDGDAGAQIDSIRALAERPLRIQGSTKVTAIYDVNVAELPVRILGDCLRGSPAVHSSLPHTPVVRAQAALAIAQWQNNKAPKSKDAVGLDHWVGANLLFQYFRERFYSNGVIMPVKFSRLALKSSEAEAAVQAAVSAEGGGGAANPKHDDHYEYLDSLEEGEERAAALETAERLEMEEDEEYRVRSAVVTAIASLRAKDGQTPSFVIKFLETLLEAEDAEMVGNLVYPDEELMVEQAFRSMKAESSEEDGTESDDDDDGHRTPSLSFVAGMLVADALLALCYINSSPSRILDPTTRKHMQASGRHPVSRLMELACGWLEWELYREKIRDEVAAETSTGVSGNCHNTIAASAVLALSNLAILKQCTTDPSPATDGDKNMTAKEKKLEEVATSKFYIDIFDCVEPQRNDLTRAACAQAITCICCAADRFEKETANSVGLLTALGFLLDRILEDRTSPSLRQTLAALMMDACTGKICSTHRVGSIAGRNDLITSAARYFNGPLGASHGGDNGSAVLTSVSSGSFPTASAVNDGARRGLRLLSRAGHPRDKQQAPEATVVRVARFATRLWRTINGEPAEPPPPSTIRTGLPVTGVCTYDGALRCSLLALWQWIWPRGCFAVLLVHSWKPREYTEGYKQMGAHHVMKITEEEKQAATAEENSLADIDRFVQAEIDRQAWRGEQYKKRYEMFRASKGSSSASMQDVAAAEQGINQPLPPIERDTPYKQGGWIASAARQRRALALDGGTAVTKLKLSVKKSSDT